MPELFKYSYRVLKFDLTAGLVDFEIPIDARKVVYASPTDGPELSLRLQSKSNDQIPLRPQGEIVAPFQRLYLSASPVAKTIFLLIGSPEDIQLTGRDVSISGEIATKTLVENNGLLSRLYSGGFDLAAGGVGNFTQAMLLNPTGSGKTVIATKWGMSRATIGLTGLTKTTGGINGTSLLGTAFNHQPSSAPSNAQIRRLISVSFLSVQWYQLFKMEANIMRVFDAFHVLNPGDGLVIAEATGNIAYSFFFEFVEFDQ